jgi:CRISPR-associated protein Csd2
MNHLDPNKLHQAYFIYDCSMGNPNGDPDRGNLPRQDDETGHGIVTSGCIKRKIRNFVDVAGQNKPDKERYKILIQENTVINEQIERAYSSQDLFVAECQKSRNKKIKVSTVEQQLQVQRWIVENYWDVRAFGAVLSTGIKAGTVCGPLQVSMSRSIDRIHPVVSSITRCASTNKTTKTGASVDDNNLKLDKDGNLIDAETGEIVPIKDNKTMGTKTFLSYALYECHIFYSPLKDKHKSVTSEDLEIFWNALLNMWDLDRSDARGFMATRGLWIFSHDNCYGNYPAHKVFESIDVNSNVQYPRAFSDYQIIDNSDQLTKHGISVVNLINQYPEGICA